jgi:hypothetical protein
MKFGASNLRMTRLPARVFLLAALTLSLSAVRSAAGCGDHVQVNPKAGERSQADESMPSHGHRPCHGPTCSRHDRQPMPAGATVRVAPPEDLRQTTSESFDRAQQSLDRLVPGLPLLAVPSVQSIFHPPR